MKNEKQKRPMIMVTTRENIGFVNANLQPIHSHRPNITPKTDLLEQAVADRHIKVIVPELPPEASDAEFLEYYRESVGDTDLAIDSYLAKIGYNRDGDRVKKGNKDK